jgi:hypothetical protein
MINLFIIIITLIISLIAYFIHTLKTKTKNKNNELFLMYDDKCMYLFHLCGLYGNNVYYEVSSTLIKYFGLDYFMEYYKDSFQSAYKNDKLTHIDLYVCEKYGEKRHIKTFNITT